MGTIPGYLLVLAIILTASDVCQGSTREIPRCVLASGSSSGFGGIGLCLGGHLESDFLYREQDPKSSYLTQGEVYTGLHIGSLVSFHARNRLRSGHGGEDGRGFEERTTRSLYTQFGSLSNLRFRLLLGKFLVPIGINYSDSFPILDWIYRRHHFWGSARPTASVSLGDLVGTRVDLSYTKFKKELKEDEPRTEAYAIRLVHDLSALEGTRLVFSHYRSQEGEVKMGVGLVNSPPGGQTTIIEWFRVVTPDYVGPYPFKQLIRVSSTGRFKNDTRMLFEYEDDLEAYYLTTMGYDHRVYREVLFRLGVAYRRSRFDDMKNHWLGLVGMRFQL